LARSEDQPPARTGGCLDYRLSLVLAALRRRLDEDLEAEEERDVRAQIAALEEQLGL